MLEQAFAAKPCQQWIDRALGHFHSGDLPQLFYDRVAIGFLTRNDSKNTELEYALPHLGKPSRIHSRTPNQLIPSIQENTRQLLCFAW